MTADGRGQPQTMDVEPTLSTDLRGRSWTVRLGLLISGSTLAAKPRPCAQKPRRFEGRLIILGEYHGEPVQFELPDGTDYGGTLFDAHMHLAASAPSHYPRTMSDAQAIVDHQQSHGFEASALYSPNGGHRTLGWYSVPMCPDSSNSLYRSSEKPSSSL